MSTGGAWKVKDRDRGSGAWGLRLAQKRLAGACERELAGALRGVARRPGADRGHPCRPGARTFYWSGAWPGWRVEHASHVLAHAFR
ncbi:hypothetical protein NDU88_004367 [Pleurodeles waltl]|uniref:Uncharacterized protein n=1 Tax=Pleurodeles waltl TaxID=8319 RepID=A0AAV7WRP1_PLEWA|nr:hypothetical protein NDU88_004367 [Pleurodeles waltl]